MFKELDLGTDLNFYYMLETTLSWETIQNDIVSNSVPLRSKINKLKF